MTPEINWLAIFPELILAVGAALGAVDRCKVERPQPRLDAELDPGVADVVEDLLAEANGKSGRPLVDRADGELIQTVLLRSLAQAAYRAAYRRGSH